MKSLAIEREFGSGGREIGLKVAETAGIPYYDGELLHRAAEALGLSVGMLEDYDEQRTGSFLYDLAAYTTSLQAQTGKNVFELFYAVQRTMERLHKDGPAVFIGRCSTEILKKSSNVLRVYIYSSDPADRIRRTIQTEGVTEKEALRLIEKKDKQRSNYFRFWTEKEWKNRYNYDMGLNTSTLSVDTCAGILLNALNS